MRIFFISVCGSDSTRLRTSFLGSWRNPHFLKTRFDLLFLVLPLSVVRRRLLMAAPGLTILSNWQILLVHLREGHGVAGSSLKKWATPAQKRMLWLKKRTARAKKTGGSGKKNGRLRLKKKGASGPKKNSYVLKKGDSGFAEINHRFEMSNHFT